MNLEPEIIVAIVAGAVALTSAAFVFMNARMQSLNRRVEVLESRDRRLWAYVAKLRDHIYKGLGPPPPQPDDLDDLFPTG